MHSLEPKQGLSPPWCSLIGPSDDPDADATDSLVHEFVIGVTHRGQGHGSRLLHALVETMRLDGYQRATWWVNSTDDVMRKFITSTGWDADGAHRELGNDDGATLKQIRLHTDISSPASD